ncbi:hypothetical protein J2X69_002154 [Algoriphagus sp. 4150]|nr:hypothetical protein [Algoriphagus sp. 4150]
MIKANFPNGIEEYRRSCFWRSRITDYRIEDPASGEAG